jgi:hypothetical protein
MTDDEKAAAIDNALDEEVPTFLDDTGLQRIAYSLGINGKPTLVTDAQLDKIAGTSLYRTVHNAYLKGKDLGFSAQEICDQVRAGAFTMYADSGGTAHGRGIYFADTYSGSTIYQVGRASDNLVMRAKYAPNARIIAESTARNGMLSEISRGTKLGKAISRADPASRMAIYALAKGYDAIQDSGSGYNMVINRGALIMSTTTKHPSTRW